MKLSYRYFLISFNPTIIERIKMYKSDRYVFLIKLQPDI